MGIDNIAYKVSYRNIKYPRLELKTGGLLLVLPFGYDRDAILNKHRSWIRKKTEFIKDCLRSSSDKEIIDRTDRDFKDLISSSIERASAELNVKVNKVYLRKMRSKWASCSPKGNLTINRSLKCLPEHLIEYVIFHEVAHILEKRHNDGFWKIISRKFSNYQELERDLFIYWFRISNGVMVL